MTVSTGRKVRLPPRQLQVAELAARGYSNKEIARHLGVCGDTVKIHLKLAYRALGIRARWMLRDALEQRLLPPLPDPPTDRPAPVPPLVPLYPCPHGCGAELAVSSCTPEGERALCGSCRGPTLYAAGALVTCRGAP